MNNNVILLGGCGFIGRNLTPALMDAGWNVTITSQSAEKARRIANEIGAFGREFNIARDCANNQLFEGFSAMIYLVGGLLPKSSNQNMTEELSSITPFCMVLESCIAAGVQKVLLVSSGGTVYGCGTPPFPEDARTEPITTYGLSKLIQEKVLAIASRMQGIDYRIVRLSNPYGPHQNASKGQGVIAAFIERGLLGEPLVVYGDGSVVRDFVYIEDACAGIAAALHYDGPEKVFNIGSGEGTAIREVASLVRSYTGCCSRINFLEGRPVDVPENYLDISLARRELGFKIATSLPDGIYQTVRWAQNEAGLED